MSRGRKRPRGFLEPDKGQDSRGVGRAVEDKEDWDASLSLHLISHLCGSVVIFSTRLPNHTVTEDIGSKARYVRRLGRGLVTEPLIPTFEG